MSNYTIDATLEVDASSTFPKNFPFFFGPTASGTRNAIVHASQLVTATATEVINLTTNIAALKLSTASFLTDVDAAWDVNTVESITAAVVANAGIAWSADALLACTVTTAGGTGFAYLADVSLAVTGTELAAITHNQFCEATQSATVSRAMSALASWNANASLSVVGTAVVSAMRNQFADASLSVTNSILAHTAGAFAIQSSMVGASSTDAIVLWDALFAAPLQVTTESFMGAGIPQFADTSLDISIYATFPYTFPFVFEQSFDTASKGQSVGAALWVTTSKGAEAILNRFGDAGQSVMATPSILFLQGGEKAVDGSLAVTSSAEAAITRNQGINAPQQVTAIADSNILGAATVTFQIEIEATTPSTLSLAGLLDSGTLIEAATTTNANMSALINSYFESIASTMSESTRGQVGDARLSVGADASGQVSYDAIADIQLTIQTLMGATAPEATGFWSFYLR